MTSTIRVQHQVCYKFRVVAPERRLFRGYYSLCLMRTDLQQGVFSGLKQTSELIKRLQYTVNAIVCSLCKSDDKYIV